jgi:hypothetical protein
MKRLIFLLIVATITSIMFATTPSLTLHKSVIACVPDGIAYTDGTEPWTSTWIPMNAEKTTNTKHEMTAFFQIAIDDEFFWIVALQKGNSTMDTGAVAIPNSWERDNFEVYISMDTTSWKYGGAYGEANNLFRMERAAIYPWGFDDYHSIGANNKDFKIGVVDAGDGSFIEEWQIPWAGLIAPMKDSGKFDGNYIKFDIQAADNTTGLPGGLTQQLFWASNTDKQANNTEYLGLVYITEEACKKSVSFDVNGVMLQPDCNIPNPAIIYPNPAINNPNNAIIYPNPANEYLKISNETTLKYVTIKNMLGEVKASIAVNNQKTITIPIADFACGIYLVTISDITGSTYISKVVKR